MVDEALKLNLMWFPRVESDVKEENGQPDGPLAGERDTPLSSFGWLTSQSRQSLSWIERSIRAQTRIHLLFWEHSEFTDEEDNDRRRAVDCMVFRYWLSTGTATPGVPESPQKDMDK
ncbi:hypothetical protein AOLI_G00281750 [Acnodon oligacanthus]